MSPKTNIDTCSCGSSWYSKKGTNKYLQQIPGEPSITEIQKIVLTSTGHILQG